MSTNIHNGFRFISRSLGRIHEQLTELRQEILAAQKQGQARWAATAALRIVDSRALGLGGLPEGPPLEAILRDFGERHQEMRRTRRRDTDIDWDFGLAVLPWKGRVYGMYYAEQPELAELLILKDWVEDYRYWDNSDHPEDVTPAQWNARRETWNGILAQDHMGRPAGCGLTFDVEADFFLPEEEEIVAAAPSFDERVRYHARNRVVTAHMKRLVNDISDPPLEWAAHSGIRTAMAAMDYARTPEGLKEVEEEAAAVAEILGEFSDPRCILETPRRDAPAV